MMWWGSGMNFWGMLAMGGGTLLFWAVLVVAAVLLIDYVARGTNERRRPAPGAPPDRILAERFARGEIDEKDYRERLHVLHGSGE